MTWSITEFLSREENKFFIEIEKSWITDRFNLTDLNENVPEDIWNVHGKNYYRGMRMLGGIRDVEYSIEQEKAGEFFYGLLHKRYTLTNAGIAKLTEKYESGVYGKCPKLSCFGQICLPIGQFDEPGRTSVSIYCPRCMDIFNTDNSELDGAFFGQNLPHMYMMVKPEKRPCPSPIRVYEVTKDDRVIFKPKHPETISKN